jgi:hypothetical protein
MLNQDLLAERFPHARYHSHLNLVTWFPTGVLDNEGADRILEFLESEEPVSQPFHRYTDMTGFTRIQIGLDHVVRIARRRKRGYKGPVVKSAFFAVRLISLSVARMYEELMQGSQINVRTFRDRADAAKWLGVPVEVLQSPKPNRYEP